MVESWIGDPLDDTQRLIMNVAPTTRQNPLPSNQSIQDEVPPEWRVLEGITQSEMDILDSALGERVIPGRPNPFADETNPD